MADGVGTALITGASAGIGAAYADHLASRGKALILVARRRERLQEFAAALRQKSGCSVETIVADLADPSDLAAVAAAIRTTDDIDMVINNAGLGASGLSVAVDPRAVEQIVKVNVLALTMLSLAAMPRFLGRNRGTLINLSSLIAFKASPYAAAYCGSKAFVLNFTRSLQAECARTDVKVQLLVPGYVDTEFFGGAKPPVPEDQVMSAATLVACSMKALDEGEPVCIPTLDDESALGKWEAACRTIADASLTAQPAARYASVQP